MAITIDEIAKHMEALELKFKKPDEQHIVLMMPMKNYRNSDGDDGLLLVVEVSENGKYFMLFAPRAFKAVGPHVDSFLKACTIIQWRTKLIQFEYDATDGEIRPVIEFPVEDGTVTKVQLARCINGIRRLIDEYYLTLKRALDEGVVEFGERNQEMGQMLGDMMQQMLAGLTPEAREALLRRLAESVATPTPADGSVPAGQGATAPSKPPTEL